MPSSGWLNKPALTESSGKIEAETSMRDWRGILIGVVCGLLGAGVLYLVSQPPRGEAVKLLPPPTPAPLIIYISGAVSQPGVYTLPADSRVKDAIEAAGGLLTDASVDNINLAAFLRDGAHLEIPTTASQPQTPSDSSTKLININNASQSELESLPEIGPSLARAIIAYREEHGPFGAVEDIQKVTGIGPAIFEQISHLITVDDQY